MQILIGRNTKIVRTRFGGDYRKYIEYGMMAEWGQAAVNWQAKNAIPAEIIRSKWTGRCPHCAGAAFIDPAHPFFCPTCGLAGNDHQAMNIIWPDPKLKAQIEWVLLQRPNPKTRNWLPRDGETLATLIAENIEHGHLYDLPERLR